MRNSKVFDLVNELSGYSCKVDVWDPLVDKAMARYELGESFIDEPQIGQYDAIVVAVPHQKFLDFGPQKLKSYGKKVHVLFDLKYAFDKAAADARL